MSTLFDVVIYIAGLLAMIAITLWLDTRFPCNCGRERRPYFHKEHEKLWLMLVYSVLATIASVVFILQISWIASIIMSLVAVYDWYRIYYHEKDKIRKALRSMGRVVIGGYGKLKVVND